MCHSQRDDPDWENVKKHVYSNILERSAIHSPGKRFVYRFFLFFFCVGEKINIGTAK